jgi:hypothetical protein
MHGSIRTTLNVRIEFRALLAGGSQQQDSGDSIRSFRASSSETNGSFNCPLKRVHHLRGMSQNLGCVSEGAKAGLSLDQQAQRPNQPSFHIEAKRSSPPGPVLLRLVNCSFPAVWGFGRDRHCGAEESVDRHEPTRRRRSGQTTERYLGCKQRFRDAVNDRIGLEPDRRDFRRSRTAARLSITNLA